MTDEEIRSLIELPKIISQKNFAKLCALEPSSGAYRRADVIIKGTEDVTFRVHGRLSIDDPSDFSAILSAKTRQQDIILIRCNGSSHDHHNFIEKNRIRGTHIHMATARYADMQRKDEGYAEPTDEYSDYEGAVDYLMRLANISVNDDSGQMTLFGDP